VDVDPQFRDPSVNNYRLATGSPIIDLGRNSNTEVDGLVVVDIDGNTRGVLGNPSAAIGDGSGASG
jgi:hypothetical protein